VTELSPDLVRLSVVGPEAALRLGLTRRQLLWSLLFACGGLGPALVRIVIGIARPWELWFVGLAAVSVALFAAWSWVTLPRRLAQSVDDAHIARTAFRSRSCSKCKAILVPLDVASCWRCGATRPLGRTGVLVLALIVVVTVAAVSAWG
jgi:hypothetical protein